jgi:hypothetical protein
MRRALALLAVVGGVGVLFASAATHGVHSHLVAITHCLGPATSVPLMPSYNPTKNALTLCEDAVAYKLVDHP